MMNINTYENKGRNYVALNMNSFVRFKPNDKGQLLIKQSQVHQDEFNIDEDGFYSCPMHLFVQAFGADIGCSAAYVEGNTFAIEVSSQEIKD